MEMKILNYVLCIIEYATFFFFLRSLLESRFKTLIPLILAIIIGATIMYFCMGLDLVIKTLIGCAVLFIGSSILFNSKIPIKFSYIFLLLFTVSIVDIIIGYLFALVFMEDLAGIFFSDFGYRLISCLVIKVIDIVVFFFIQRAFKRVDKNVHSKYWGLLGVIFLILHGASIIFLKLYLKSHQGAETNLIFLFVSLAFFVMSLIVIYFFTEICAGLQRDKRLFVLETNNRTLEEALALQNSNAENLRKIKHDITKHTLNAIALIESGKSDDAAALLRNAEENAAKNIQKYNVNTGNNVVDAIISSKAAICESKGITFTYCIEPLQNIKIETADLSSLLSNLLDNSIEAAQQTVNGNIRIEIFKYKVYYGICIENSFKGKSSIVHSGLQLLSTKPNDTMHGYGTQIIEDIAQKYNGHSTWNADGERFKTNVLLKI